MDTLIVLMVLAKFRELAMKINGDVGIYIAVDSKLDEQLARLEMSDVITFSEKVEISFAPLQLIALEPKLSEVSAFWLRSATKKLDKEKQLALLGAMDEMPDDAPPEIINEILKKLCE